PRDIVDEVLQSFGVVLRPAFRRRDAGPTADVVRRVNVSKTWRRTQLVEHIGHRLHARDDWKPADVVRHAEPTRLLHPFRRPPEHLDTPKNRGIRCMLKVNDPRHGPFGVQRRLIRISIHEPYGSAPIEYWEPHRRPGIPLASELRVDRITVLGA